MVTLIEMLPWDSDCFGFKVARWRGLPDAASLKAGLPGIQAEGVRLLYIQIPGGNPDPRAWLSSAGARWVDRRTRYARDLEPARAPAVPGPVWSFPAQDPTVELRELAKASGAHSRFKVDAEMPAGCFERLYETWIRRSTLREIADEVLVRGTEDQVRGLVTVKLDMGTARIGLIAVDADARGKGHGTELIRAAEAWAARQGASRMEVVTQGANREACALYERCGYRIEQAEDVYHLWIAAEVP